MKQKKREIIFINLSTRQLKSLKYSKSFHRNYLGGRGFNTRILYELRYLLPLSPLSESNVICISNGAFTGTKFPSASRTTLSLLKSPVSQMFSDSSIGGFFGHSMSLAGLQTIIITGRADRPVSILIRKGRPISIEDVPHTVWTDNAINSTKYFKDKYGKKSVALTIGQSGVAQVFCSAVMQDQRLAAGCGPGAVFGSKNLKGIIIEPIKDEYIVPDNKDRFKEYVKAATHKIVSHPVFNMFKVYGTSSLVEIHSALRYFPAFNFTTHKFKDYKKISGKRVVELEKKEEGVDFLEGRRKAQSKGELNCHNCPIRCSGKHRMEYEPLACLGSKIGVSDLDFIFEINDWLGDIGADVIQPTSLISALMHMYHDGVSNYVFEWGNKNYVRCFLSDLLLRKNTHYTIGFCFSDGFESGLRFAVKKGYITLTGLTIEEAVDKYFVANKNMGIPGVYPSKSQKGVALAISTSSRGGDHLRALPTLASYANWYLKKGGLQKLWQILRVPFFAMGLLRYEKDNVLNDLYETYNKTFGVPKEICDEWKASNFLFDSTNLKDWGLIIRFTQNVYAVSDALGMCRFTTPWRFGIGPELMASTVSALFNIKYDWKDIMNIGRKIYDLERSLQYHYNNPRCNDNLPGIFFKKRKKNLTREEYDKMLNGYYYHCDYDKDGRPNTDFIDDEPREEFLEFLKSEINYER